MHGELLQSRTCLECKLLFVSSSELLLPRDGRRFVSKPSLRATLAAFFITLSIVLSFHFPVLHGQQTQPGTAAPPLPDGRSNSRASEPASVLKITTRLVLVDVVATDRKGLPVKSLDRDAFTVLEDGKPQAVRVFSFQEGNASPAEQPASSSASLPPDMVTNIRPLKNKGPLNVLLLDGLNTRMNNQEYVKSQLLELLKRLPAEEPLAIYLLGTRLELIQDFTSDPEILREVITHLKDLHSPLMDNAAGGPQRFWFEGMPLPPDVKRRVLEFQQNTESEQMDQRVAITLAALHSLARTLAGYPGRKNLIWVSESFPITVFPNKVPHGEKAFEALRVYGQRIDTTANWLTDAQIAVYPIDARALVNSYAYDPSVRFDVRGDGITPGKAASDLADEVVPAHSTMEAIAADTGGRATYNRNDIGDAVRSSIEDGSTYYTLGYYPESRSWDGSFRKISVKVSLPGVTLRYRAGYFATDPLAYAKASAAQRDAEFNAALSPEVPLATALRFVARVAAPSPQNGNQAVVTFSVDARALSFTEESDGKKHASIECVARAFSRKAPDRPLRTEAENIDANLPLESYQKIFQTGLPCRTAFTLPAGEYLLRLGVRDNRTGLVGTANATLEVPAESAAAGKTPGSEPRR